MTELKVGQVYEFLRETGDGRDVHRIVLGLNPVRWVRLDHPERIWEEGPGGSSIATGYLARIVRDDKAVLIVSFTPFDGWISVCHDWLCEFRPNVPNVDKLLTRPESEERTATEEKR